MRIYYRSKYKIERITPEENSILISIAGMSDNFAGVNKFEWKDILRIRFSDVYRDYGHRLAFREFQAYSILKFVKDNLPVSCVYVNCEMGLSRSAGIAFVLDYLYNGTRISERKCNVHVLNLMLKASHLYF
jgi:predicted protein tyrosine phosphatase